MTSESQKQHISSNILTYISSLSSWNNHAIDLNSSAPRLSEAGDMSCPFLWKTEPPKHI